MKLDPRSSNNSVTVRTVIITNVTEQPPLEQLHIVYNGYNRIPTRSKSMATGTTPRSVAGTATRKAPGRLR